MDSEADAKPQIAGGPCIQAYPPPSLQYQSTIVSQYTTRSTAMAQLTYTTAATAGQQPTG